MPIEVKDKLVSLEFNGSSILKVVKGKKGFKRNLKGTKFEEYLQMEMQNSAVLAEEDLELERKLAKKLRVKVGKLRGEDDGINSLFEGIPSIIDSLGEEELPGAEEFSDKSSKSKKKKKRKSLDQGLESDVAGDSSVGVSEPVKILDAYMSEEGPALSRKKRKRRKLSEPGQECDEVGDTAIGASNPVEPCGGEVVLEEVSAKAPAGKGDGKYVVSHLRGRSGNELEEYTKVRRHVRGMKSVILCLTRLFLPLMLNFFLLSKFLILNLFQVF
jgi:nucleolar MIF4G domain-containing protein 1